jgi:hypothetical protein
VTTTATKTPAPPAADPTAATTTPTPPTTTTAPTTTAPTTTATTTTGVADSTTAPALPRRLSPWDVSLQLALDFPASPRLPMASTRIDVTRQFALPSQSFACLGVRTGYSYVAGDIAVVDPALGVDQHALLMAHRVPLRLVARAGLRADDGLAVGAIVSGGADVAAVQAQSFGRVATPLALVPGASLGAFATRSFGETMHFGVVGEWDSAALDLSATTPGLSGDLSALRIAFELHFDFG